MHGRDSSVGTKVRAEGGQGGASGTAGKIPLQLPLLVTLCCSGKEGRESGKALSPERREGWGGNVFLRFVFISHFPTLI